MSKSNNYPYTNMVYQNIDWMADEVKAASEKAEHAEQTVQEMDSRIQRMEEIKVDKISEPYRLYGTDGSGEQTSRALDFFHNFQAQSVPVRSVTGAIRTPAPTLDNDAANKKYVDDAVSGAGGAKWTTVVDDTIETALDSNSKTYALQDIECEELKITTIIDNGDTDPTLYTSTDLDVSVNGGFFFSIDGAVPQSSSQRRVQEDTEVKSWDWSGFGFGDVSYVALSKVFSNRAAFQNAEVSITSSLSGRTFDYQYDIGEEEITIDTPGFRGHQVKFVQSGGDTIYGVYLTEVNPASEGVVPGQVIFNAFLPTTDVSEFSAGYWSYDDSTVEHKIATGTLDMTFINTEMAETETSGSGNRDDIDDGHIIPMSNIKHYAIHPADHIISTVQVRVSNGVIREGTRIIIQYKK